jgi:hypothetical protein
LMSGFGSRQSAAVPYSHQEWNGAPVLDHRRIRSLPLRAGRAPSCAQARNPSGQSSPSKNEYQRTSRIQQPLPFAQFPPEFL